jgi:hypothetical protein
MDDKTNQESPQNFGTTYKQISPKHNLQFTHRRTVRYFALGVLLLLLIVLAISWSIRPQKITHNPNPNPYSNLTKVQLLEAAAPILTDQSRQDQLKQIVSKIQSIPNYQQDPNYLYIVVQYNTNIGNIQNAQSYYNDLIKIYNSKRGLSTVLSGDGASINLLNDQITYLHNLQTQTRNYIRVQ